MEATHSNSRQALVGSVFILLGAIDILSKSILISTGSLFGYQQLGVESDIMTKSMEVLMNSGPPSRLPQPG